MWILNLYIVIDRRNEFIYESQQRRIHKGSRESTAEEIICFVCLETTRHVLKSPCVTIGL